jgi:hypothetical protein
LSKEKEIRRMPSEAKALIEKNILGIEDNY